MNQEKVNSEAVDHSLLYHEFRWATAWGWSIIGAFAIYSALTSQKNISNWQIYFTVAVVIAIFCSYGFHKIFNSALSYTPVPLVLWISPFLIRDENQNPWISIGFIAIATIMSLSNIEDLRFAIPLMLGAIFLQQFIASLNLPSITDSLDLQLLRGYFGITWGLLIGAGLIIIRQGYIKYHDSIDKQIAKIYENQIKQSKSVLAINTADYRNIQLHGTVLNTLIYARDNLKISLRSDRINLAKLIRKDIEVFTSKLKPKDSLERQIRLMLKTLGIRELAVWLNAIDEMNIDEETRAQVIEIVREKILNLKKHTKAENCDISIQIAPIETAGISVIRPVQYRLFIQFSDDSLIHSSTARPLDLASAKQSKSLKRLLSPLNAVEEYSQNLDTLIHRIEIPLLNFQPNAVEQLYELRRTSQEFVAKSYVLISMFYGALCIPALIRIDVPIPVLILATAIVIGSFCSILLPKYNLPITGLNSILALILLPLSVSISNACSDLQFLPWVFNGILGPIFFAVLTIPQKYLRWLPVVIFFIESIIVSNNLPAGCETILSGSTPGIVILAALALLVLNIRNRNTKKDQELVQKFKRDSSRFVETRVRIQQEQEEIIELLSKFSTELISEKVSVSQAKGKLNLLILHIRALLVSTEYFDSKLVQAIYFEVKLRLSQQKSTELHILTDKFNDFSKEDNYAQISRLMSYRNASSPLRISVISTDKTEIRVNRNDSRSNLRTFFEDKKVRLLRD